MLRPFGTLLLLAAVAHPAAAQAPLTLADAIGRARAQNPDVAGTAAAGREAGQRVTQARAAAFLPRVDLTESWQRSDQPVFVFSSLLSQRRFTAANFAVDALNHPDAIDNFRTSIVAEQPLLDRTARAGRSAAGIAEEIADARGLQVAQDLAVGVTAAFGRVLTAIESRRSAAAALDTASADRELAANRRDAGLTTDADVLALDVFTARSREQQIRAAADERTARAELNQLMGEPLGSVFVLDPHAAAAGIETADLDALQSEALANSPAVKIAALEERLGASAIDTAHAVFLPSIAAQGGWEFNGGAWTDRLSSWMVGAFARVNLFRGFADKARLAEAREQLTRRSADRRKAEDAARLEVYTAAARLDAARAAEAVGRAAAAQARESRRIVRDRYESGLADVSALLRATESVVQAEAQQAGAAVGVPVSPPPRSNAHWEGNKNEETTRRATRARRGVVLGAARPDRGLARAGGRVDRARGHGGSAAIFEAGGVVQARTTATLTARILAPVREVRVAPGDRVRAGQTLVVLDADALTSQARSATAAASASGQAAVAAAAEQRAAEASLALARASYDRIASLSARRSATAQELDNATGALRAAEARAASAAAATQAAGAQADSARSAGDAAGTTAGFAQVKPPSMASSRRRWWSRETWRHRACPFCGSRTCAASGSRSAWTSRGSPLSRAASPSKSCSIPRRARSKRSPEPWPRSLAPWTWTRARSWSRSRCPKRRDVPLRDVRPRTLQRRNATRTAGCPTARSSRRGQLTSVFVVDGGVARLRLVNVSGKRSPRRAL